MVLFLFPSLVLARWSTIAILTFEVHISHFFLNIFIKKVSSLWLIYRFSPFMEIIFNWVDDNWHFSSRGFVRVFSSWISAEQLICKVSRNLDQWCWKIAWEKSCQAITWRTCVTNAECYTLPMRNYHIQKATQ